MEAVETRLVGQLRRVYSGAGRGAGASTRVQASLGRLRANQVYVVGDVAIPGSKQVSATGPVLTALYAAGGPTERGSFRRVEVRRGEGIAGTVDLYRYLLNGDASSDIRLEHGDRVFVPPAGPRVRLRGAVRRPATYEIMPVQEGLRELLAFAGGLQANAVVQRVQIDRILPPGERTPGRYRVVRDVDLTELFGDSASLPLADGDVVYVHAVPDEVRERVWITGAVNNPGIFEWSQGLTLAGLIGRADGLDESAYRTRLQIYRQNPGSGERAMLQASAPGSSNGEVLLQDGDSVVVLDREELRNPESVSIDGFVKEPGDFAYAQGMTVRDLVLAAGGSCRAPTSRSPKSSGCWTRSRAAIRPPRCCGWSWVRPTQRPARPAPASGRPRRQTPRFSLVTTSSSAGRPDTSRSGRSPWPARCSTPAPTSCRAAPSASRICSSARAA
jgi:protein involved in polysaccharide export with SLBB domain